MYLQIAALLISMTVFLLSLFRLIVDFKIEQVIHITPFMVVLQIITVAQLVILTMPLSLEKGQSIFWVNIMFVASNLLTVSYIRLTIASKSIHLMSNRIFTAISFPFLLTSLLVLNKDSRVWFYSLSILEQRLVIVHKSWFWVNEVSGLLIMLVSAVFLLRTVMPNKFLFSPLVKILLIGLLWKAGLFIGLFVSRWPDDYEISQTSSTWMIFSAIAILWVLLGKKRDKSFPTSIVALLNNLEYGVLVLDHAGCILTTNVAAKKLLGISNREINKANAPEMHPEIARAIQSGINSKKTYSELVKADESFIIVEVNHIINNELIYGFLVLLTNITEFSRKKKNLPNYHHILLQNILSK